MHVYNYAKAPTGLMERAKAEAARAFRRSGIVVELADCPLSEAALGKYPACKAGSPSMLLVVKVMPRTMPASWSRSRLELGAALLDTPGTFAHHAYVFFDRVKERAEIKSCDLAILLGYAIAHEVGHLLLGQGGHSSQGIMRADWSKEDLFLAQKGDLNFRPAQAEKMTAEITRRMQLMNEGR